MADRIGLASFAALTSSRAFRSSNPLHTHDFLRYAFDPCDLTETELRLGQDAVSCGRAPVHHADRVAKLVSPCCMTVNSSFQFVVSKLSRVLCVGNG